MKLPDLLPLYFVKVDGVTVTGYGTLRSPLSVPILSTPPSDPTAKFLIGTGVWDNKLGTSTNYSAWDSTGHQTMSGNARPWRDELTDALNIKTTGTGVALNTADNTVEFSAVAAYANDYLYLNVQLNHDKDLSSSIYPHIHFFQKSNAVPNFVIQYRWQKSLGEKVTSWSILKCNTLAEAYSGTTKNNIAYCTPIAPPTGSGLSDIVQFRVGRDTGNVSGLFTGADPFAGVAGVLAVDIHFQINSFGSTDEYIK